MTRPTPSRAVLRPSRFFTCEKHGWDALGSPCPQCKSGDGPKICVRHGWNHVNKGCPDCEAGRNPFNFK